jgi:hypothetical protein
VARQRPLVSATADTIYTLDRCTHRHSDGEKVFLTLYELNHERLGRCQIMWNHSFSTSQRTTTTMTLSLHSLQLHIPHHEPRATPIYFTPMLLFNRSTLQLDLTRPVPRIETAPVPTSAPHAGVYRGESFAFQRLVSVAHRVATAFSFFVACRRAG